MIPTFLIKRFGPTGAKIAFLGFIGVVLAIVISGFALHERHAGATGELVKEQARTIEVQQKVGVANGKAAETRVHDAIKVETQKQELNDVLTSAKDGDDARRRSGCAILRQQGRDTSRIAACR